MARAPNVRLYPLAKLPQGERETIIARAKAGENVSARVGAIASSTDPAPRALEETRHDAETMAGAAADLSAARQAAEMVARGLRATARNASDLVKYLDKIGPDNLSKFVGALREEAMSEGRFVLFGRREPEVDRQEIVDDMNRQLQDYENLKTFPSTLQVALENRVWEGRRNFADWKIMQACSFHDFIHKPYPQGIGTTDAIIENLIQHDQRVVSLWNAERGIAPPAKHGAPAKYPA
jgi:hypothetical protein